MDFNKLFQEDLPKMMGMTDDMHLMATCIYELRTLLIIVTVTGYIGGIVFLITKCIMGKKKKKRSAEYPRKHDPEWRRSSQKRSLRNPHADDNLKGVTVETNETGVGTEDGSLPATKIYPSLPKGEKNGNPNSSKERSSDAEEAPLMSDTKDNKDLV